MLVALTLLDYHNLCQWLARSTSFGKEKEIGRGERRNGISSIKGEYWNEVRSIIDLLMLIPVVSTNTMLPPPRPMACQE
jgi:hypothetical protein